MYHWIKDKKFLGEIKRPSADLLNQLVQYINKDGKMIVRAYLVGSGARNLFTQNGNEPIDLDYNLEVIKIIDNYNFRSGSAIKEYVRKKFNVVLKKNGRNDCQDSTSALTIRIKQRKKIKFSIDICIVKQNDYGYHRLIHDKSSGSNIYRWEMVQRSKGIDERIEWLKNNHLWLEVRETYLKKKNMYLRRPYDHNHPSFVVYIESVNEVYNRY